MRAFKTFIASAIACALILSMATSAFAAADTITVNGVDTDSKVSATITDSYAGSGERTVLVVNQEAWDGSKLLDGATIMYINQVANAELGATLNAMAGKNLIHGDYTVLVGNENGTVDSGNFTAIKVERVAADGDLRGETILDVAEGETAVYWNVTMNGSLVSEIAASKVKAKFYATDDPDFVDEGTVLSWGDNNLTFTGDGDFTFTAETAVGNDYVETTQLEVSAGSVSNKN